MANLDKRLPKTCIYHCEGGFLVLYDGVAPPGYYCPEILEGCSIEGEVIELEPTPLPPSETSARLVGSNSAAYQYDLVTDTLYFSRGRAEPGYMFLSKISVAELWDRFPSIAREVDLIKHAKSISSFSIEIPAVAIAHKTE